MKKIDRLLEAWCSSEIWASWIEEHRLYTVAHIHYLVILYQQWTQRRAWVFWTASSVLKWVTLNKMATILGKNTKILLVKISRLVDLERTTWSQLVRLIESAWSRELTFNTCVRFYSFLYRKTLKQFRLVLDPASFSSLYLLNAASLCTRHANNTVVAANFPRRAFTRNVECMPLCCLGSK
jgi:hypothetical protein